MRVQAYTKVRPAMNPFGAKLFSLSTRFVHCECFSCKYVIYISQDKRFTITVTKRWRMRSDATLIFK